MTRKPQGVYVNEATHNRVSLLVENALDGHGTLAGFIAYLEETLIAATDDQTMLVIRKERREALKPMREQERMRRFNDAPKDGFGAAPGDSDSAVNVARAGLETYEAAWQELGEATPWGEGDARSHVVALFLLRGDPRLWLHDQAYDAPRARHFTLYSELGRLLDLRYPEHAIYGTDKDESEELEPALLWRGGSVEALLEPAKNRSTSFYLEPEAHDLAIRAFGRDLFERAERGLLRLLDTPHHFLILEPHFNFLEHGPALVDYQWPDTDREERQKSLKALLHLLHERHGELDVRGTHPSSGFAYYITNFENTLALAADLGTLGSVSEMNDPAWRRSSLLAAFLERYQLQQLAPERRLAYQVIRHTDLPEDRTFVTNAVDYHLLRLFQTYARSVLPQDQREDKRIHPMTLATLSQQWLFPTKATLEAYGNAKATKNAAGDWELTSGRNTAIELRDAEAYWTAKALNAVLSTQPGRTVTRKLAALDDEWAHHPEWSPNDFDFAYIWARAITALDAPARIKIPLGIAIIARGLEATRVAGERPDPIAIGLRLTSQLTDAALKANGRFSKDFLSRAAFYLNSRES